MLTPDSIMPRFVGLFDVPGERVAIVDDDAGNRTLEQNEVTEAVFDFKKDTPAEHLRLTPNAGLLFVPERGKYPVIFTPNDEYTGDAVQLAVQTPELEGLIAYLQKLGMNRGKWRDVFEPQLLEASVQGAALGGVDRPRQGGLRAALRRLPRRHGQWQRPGGDLHVQVPAAQLRAGGVQVPPGQGAAADRRRPDAHDHPRHPRHGDADLARYPIEDRLAVIQYIKYELAVDRSDPSQPTPSSSRSRRASLYIGTPPEPSRSCWRAAGSVAAGKCWECHGQTGKGDGPRSADLKDDSSSRSAPPT